jgi:hypothetical protein
MRTHNMHGRTALVGPPMPHRGVWCLPFMLCMQCAGLTLEYVGGAKIVIDGGLASMTSYTPCPASQVHA